MAIRLSSSFIQSSVKNNILISQNEYFLKQQQIATGKKYTKRSEDTTNAAEAARVNLTQKVNSQYLDNITSTLNFVRVTEAKTTEVVNLLQNATELATQANNGTMPAEQRQQISNSFNTIIEQLINVSESKVGDAFLFGGTNAANAPFTVTRDTNGLVTNVAFSGNSSTELRKVQTSDSAVEDYGVLAGGASGLFQASASSNDAFATLIALRDDLAQGNQPSNTDGLALDSTLNNAIDKLSGNGVQQQWYETQERSRENSQLNNVERLADVEGVDLALSLTELSEIQTSYQASMQMASRVNSLSILNFI